MIRLGWESRTFTPERPAMLRGQKYRRIAGEAMDPLTVTALALSEDASDTDIVLVSLDIVSVPDNLLATIRKRVESSIPALRGDQLVVCATHTHSSLTTTPGKYDHPGGDVLTAAECQELVAAATVKAIEGAWCHRSPAALGRAFGHAVVGHNRYAVYDDGHARMYGETDREDFVRIGGYEDHSVDMMFTWDAERNLTGLVLGVSCPSQVDEHSDRFTADYWHDVRAKVQARFDEELHVLPLCTAAGDQSPHLLLDAEAEHDMRARRDVNQREEIATRIVSTIERELECTEPMADPSLSHRREDLALEPLQISASDRRAAHSKYQSLTEAELTSNWGRRLERVRDESQTNNGNPIEVETHQIRVGDLAIATDPFELFLDYGLRITARSPAIQTLPVQLSCGSEGYLPTAAARARGGYGATPPSATVGPAGGDQLVDATIGQLASLF